MEIEKKPASNICLARFARPSGNWVTGALLCPSAQLRTVQIDLHSALHEKRNNNKKGKAATRSQLSLSLFATLRTGAGCVRKRRPRGCPRAGRVRIRIQTAVAKKSVPLEGESLGAAPLNGRAVIYDQLAILFVCFTFHFSPLSLSLSLAAVSSLASFTRCSIEK